MNLSLLQEKLQSKVSSLGYELISVSSRKEKGELILSVVVDKVEPIDMNMIVSLSEQLSTYLDEVDDSKESYLLDVSSLGAEKPLRIDALKDYVGRYVNVHVTNPIEGINIFEGDLKEVSEDSLTLSYRIKTRVKEVVILFNNIYKIRLAIKF